MRPRAGHVICVSMFPYQIRGKQRESCLAKSEVEMKGKREGPELLVTI